MIKRMLVALAALTLAMFGAASPARADLGACPSGHVCFWNWTYFNNGGSFWSTHIQNAYGGTCVTLPAAMRDVTTSLAFNNNSGGGAGRVRFFLWINCNTSGGYLTLSDTFTPQPNLNCPTFTNPCSDLYTDNIASFTWIPN